MEPRGSSVSPLRTRKRSRTLGLRKTTLGSRSRRSNRWAECREKKIGIEPKGSSFFLTFPLIGHVTRPCCILLILKPAGVLAKDSHRLISSRSTDVHLAASLFLHSTTARLTGHPADGNCRALWWKARHNQDATSLGGRCTSFKTCQETETLAFNTAVRGNSLILCRKRAALRCRV